MDVAANAPEASAHIAKFLGLPNFNLDLFIEDTNTQKQQDSVTDEDENENHSHSHMGHSVTYPTTSTSNADNYNNNHNELTDSTEPLAATPTRIPIFPPTGTPLATPTLKPTTSPTLPPVTPTTKPTAPLKRNRAVTLKDLVIVVGLPRSGTTSVSKALEAAIGFHSAHYEGMGPGTQPQYRPFFSNRSIRPSPPPPHRPLPSCALIAHSQPKISLVCSE